MLVKAQAASNCTRVWGERRNSTKRPTTPVSMTFSIGGLRSFERSLRNFVVAAIWSSIFSEKTPCTIWGSSSFNCAHCVSPKSYTCVVHCAYLALDSCRLIITVGSGAQRGTKSLATGNSSSLCEVLLTLLLSDLDLLFLTTATELIGLQQVLCLEGGAAVLGDVAVRHSD